MADTLVTPINDSFLDFDVLGTVDPVTYSVTGESHYAEMVRDARRKRRQLDGASTDWIVVRNRLSMLESRVANAPTAGAGMQARPSTSRATDVVPALARSATCGEATPLSRAIAGVASAATAISAADRSLSLVIRFLH
jgi:hypothetical protein